MKTRHLQTRFILAGVLVVMTAVVPGIWSVWTFAHLSRMAGRTLRLSEQTITLTASLSDALEREDDALLLAVGGQQVEGRRRLENQRERFARSYGRLRAALARPEQQRAWVELGRDAARYGRAADTLLAASGEGNALGAYYERVNPALRRAVADCARIREAHFRTMEQTALLVGRRAQQAIVVVGAISVAALLVSALVALALARSVLRPVQELHASVEALRAGDFERRVRVSSGDELGRLALGVNRMAEALAEFRRSNLGEVMRAKEALEATIAALPDAVLVIDPQERIAALNPLAGAILKATGTETARSLAALPFSAAGKELIRAALRGARPSRAQIDLGGAFSVSLDGRRAKFILTADPVGDPGKGRAGAVVVLHDVTELARLDEMRMELVAVASHELKTPLTTLRMNLLMLGEDAGGLSERQREVLATALLGCRELANTIDELLDMARIEAGQLRLARELVDLRGVIEQSVAALRQRYEDARVALKVLPDDRPARVEGDPARLAMVFSNLLDNALKYTPAGGSVTVQVASGQNAAPGGGGPLHIAVTDTGPGVPAHLRDRVFEKFFRVEQAGAEDQSGTRGAGIGLYLCRQIVEAHGGSIVCKPGDNGLGTSIEFVLPASEAAA